MNDTPQTKTISLHATTEPTPASIKVRFEGAPLVQTISLPPAKPEGQQ